MNVVLASPDVVIDHSASTINKISSDMVVVVSKQSAINKLDDKNIANIFLTRTNRYPNGRKAIPIELSGSEFRNDFYQEISGKTPMELTAYWTTLIFSGKGRPPKGYGDIASLIERLEKTPTAISYISLAQVTDSLKVVYQFP
jgi:ABC-type phosphate transport system substrate-binding protein